MAATFEKNSDGTFVLDVCGLVCPHPQMYAKKSIAKIQEGDILEIIFDNPSSKETIIQMCENAGSALLEEKNDNGRLMLRIEKG